MLNYELIVLKMLFNKLSGAFEPFLGPKKADGALYKMGGAFIIGDFILFKNYKILP